MSNKVNVNKIDWQKSGQGQFSALRKQLAIQTGGEKLGASLYKLFPGEKAFPFHCHYANEEAIFVLQGRGTLRINDHKMPIVEYDYIALPCGMAHQIINTSDQELIYLCSSTMIEPDVMEYFDSNKIGVMTDSAPGGKKTQNSYKAFFQKQNEVTYYEDEK